MVSEWTAHPGGHTPLWATPPVGRRPPMQVAPRTLSPRVQPLDFASVFLPTFGLYKLLSSGDLPVLQLSALNSWCRPYCCCKSPNPWHSY